MTFIGSFWCGCKFGDYVTLIAYEIAVVDILNAFGKAVKLRRVELDMSQEVLAEKSDFARSFVSAIELGNKAASITSVWRLADALNCKPSDLLLTAERLIEGRKSVSK